jgi:hypothetical protein
METYKSEEYYYLKVCPASAEKPLSPLSSVTERSLHFNFSIFSVYSEHPSYLTITPIVRQNKESRLF